MVQRKRQDLERLKKLLPQSELLAQVEKSKPRDFYGALAGKGISIVAEAKKASPSAGLLRADYDPASIAISYEKAGAAAISVLTEEHFFQGSLKDLTLVKDRVSIPVLRKDFIFDEYQIYESAAAGADAVLLIARILTQQELAKLVGVCYKLRLSPLVEVYGEDEVDRALQSGAKIIGINNRNLRTLEIDIEQTININKRLPENRVVISESGIKSREEIERLAQNGVCAVLIGESLLKSEDPGKALAHLLCK